MAEPVPDEASAAILMTSCQCKVTDCASKRCACFKAGRSCKDVCRCVSDRCQSKRSSTDLSGATDEVRYIVHPWLIHSMSSMSLFIHSMRIVLWLIDLSCAAYLRPCLTCSLNLVVIFMIP